MTIVAGQYATLPVQRFVLALNTLMASTPQVPAARAGTLRRRKREADKKWKIADRIKSMLTKKVEPATSRQVRRAMARKQQKSLLAAARRQAMSKKVIGGSATIY